MPLLDIGYIFFWVPGVILFIFGYPLMVSWWSMLVIPVTLIIYGLLRRWQERMGSAASASTSNRTGEASTATCSPTRRWASAAALRGYGYCYHRSRPSLAMTADPGHIPAAAPGVELVQCRPSRRRTPSSAADVLPIRKSPTADKVERRLDELYGVPGGLHGRSQRARRRPQGGRGGRGAADAACRSARPRRRRWSTA